MCVQFRGSGGVEPEEIVENLVRVTNTSSVGRWTIDSLDPVGEKRMREIVAYINEMCPELAKVGWLNCSKFERVLLIL